MFSKVVALAVSVSTLANASVLGQRHSNHWVKRSGIVIGAEPGTSYYWNSTGTSQKCPTLLATDLQTSLVKFDPLFPPEYDAGPSYGGQTAWNIGALYLSYKEGTFAFDLTFQSVTPNSTATWVDTGNDIANLWTAVREDIVNLWSHNTTFQWIWYDVNKTINGASKHAGQFQVQIQTPSFVKGCDTSCGGDCNPNLCAC